LPGKVIVDNIFRRDASVAEAFYLFYLRGAQSGCISKNFIDSRFSFLICPPHNIQYLFKFWMPAFTSGG
jgi:hypothetical protein